MKKSESCKLASFLESAGNIRQGSWLDVHGFPLADQHQHRLFVYSLPTPNDTDTHRRNLNPLFFTEQSKNCFCDFVNDKRDVLSVSENSLLYQKRNDQKILFYSSECNPELRLCHFMDLEKIIKNAGNAAFFIFFNLHGSGASIPQHVHGQIIPINADGHTSVFNKLLRNTEFAKKAVTEYDEVSINEFEFPMWGVEFAFKPGIKEEEKARIMYYALQKEVRLRSQLKISYNLFITTQTPLSYKIIFRLSEFEVPFALNTIRRYIWNELHKEMPRTSSNFSWRWGGLEVLGGLPFRDDFFTGTTCCNYSFWEGFYERYNEAVLPYKTYILKQINNTLIQKTWK